MEQRLLVASKNRKKVDELVRLLDGLPFHVESLADRPDIPPVEEDGTTFLENARRKALQTAARPGEWVLADDSGLVVEALGGEPGVRSARFAGEGATDAENNALLLERLEGMEDRRAAFVCAIVIVRDGAVAWEGEGRCEGTIARQLAEGVHGFGYDPLFVPDGEQRTFAELTPSEKDRISHRGVALRAAIAFLQRRVGD